MSDLEFGFEMLGNRHCWWVRGPKGGAHIWAAATDEDFRQRFGEHFYGGIECHSPKPLYDYDGYSSEPHHEECWLLKGPCWHDGSSLQFSETIEPMMRNVKDLRSLDEFMNAELLDRYRSWFDREEA